MVVRRTISDGFDMAFQQPAIELTFRRSMRIAMLLWLFALVWIVLGFLAIYAASSVFPSSADGLLVDILQGIFNAWALPAIVFVWMFVTILSKLLIGRFAVAIGGDT